jgi:hypothetical protein
MAGWVDMGGLRFRLKNGFFFTIRPIVRILSVILLAIVSPSCGLPGGLSVSNDVVPSSASYITGGSFTSSNGVSGTAQVYLNGSSVLLHLEGLVSPGGTTYAVFLENGNPSSPFYFSPLKASQGNQNYYTGQALPGVHFSRVAIRSTTSVTSTEMAAATLAAY